MNLIKKLVSMLSGNKPERQKSGRRPPKSSKARGSGSLVNSNVKKRGKSASQKCSSRPKARKTKNVPPAPPYEELKEKLPEFSKLGLGAEELASVLDMGYIEPTPIQKKSIPRILEGKDAIGTAQTGTGKTAAFSLPIVKMLGKGENLPRVLVLSPTRELASQTAEAFKSFSKYRDLNVLLIQGGVSMDAQVRALKSGVDIVVATPGRLLDHIRQRTVSLRSVKWLVLDEVDRMFDMGFIEDVSNIISRCPKDRQTLFFSATMPDAVMRLSKWALKEDAERLDIGLACSPADTVEHFVYPVDGIQKYDLLLALLEKIGTRSAIVFTRTKIDADRVSEWLVAHGFCVTTMHSDRSQREREKALEDFKKGKASLLVATDIASRGLDISGVAYVVNFNVPEHPEDYVHRIGRTGRANREGKAMTLFSSDESTALGRIESLIGSQIERRKLEGFPYRTEPVILAEPKKKRRRRNM